MEWAHAMAPKANIALVEAEKHSLNDLFGAVDYARSLSGVVAVEMSWGTGEFYGENAYDSLFTTPAGHIGGGGDWQGGVTFVAASGDGGAWSGTSYPATSPNVLAVGGTTLSLGANSSYSSEQGWSGSTGGFSASSRLPHTSRGARAPQGLSYGLQDDARRGNGRRPIHRIVRLPHRPLRRTVRLVHRGRHPRLGPHVGRIDRSG